MAFIQATITAEALSVFGKYLNGEVGTNPFKVASFKVGEGGWRSSSGGQLPRIPDPNLTDLDCIVNPSRYPSDSLATFSKNLTSGVHTSLSITPGAITFTANCTLATGEFNNDGNSNAPDIFEIGLFGPHPVSLATFMIAYGTFAKQTKTPAISIPNIVRVQFRLA